MIPAPTNAGPPAPHRRSIGGCGSTGPCVGAPPCRQEVDDRLRKADAGRTMLVTLFDSKARDSASPAAALAPHPQRSAAPRLDHCQGEDRKSGRPPRSQEMLSLDTDTADGSDRLKDIAKTLLRDPHTRTASRRTRPGHAWMIAARGTRRHNSLTHPITQSRPGSGCVKPLPDPFNEVRVVPHERSQDGPFLPRPHDALHHRVFIGLGDPARPRPAKASYLPDAAVPSAATTLRSGPFPGML